MRHSRYSNHSSSVSSEASIQHSPTNRLKSPIPSNYEYLGRLVTRERPVIQKSKSTQQNFVVQPNKYQYHPAVRAQHREIYEDVSCPSSDDDIDNTDGLSKPIGVIRINDRHLREIYRLPTPPPKVKRVFHRLRSPETKVIERVFVRRPPPQIIENIIEVPPEKVRIINREKFLEKPKPVTRSKLIRLKPHRERHQEIEQEQEVMEEQQQTQRILVPVEQHSQPQTYTLSDPYGEAQQATTFTTSQQPPMATTTYAYPTQSTMNNVSFIPPSISSHMMLNSQQPTQISNQQPITYTYAPQYVPGQQMMTSKACPYPSHQMTPMTCAHGRY